MPKKDLSKLSLEEIKKIKYAEDPAENKPEYNPATVKQLRDKVKNGQKLTQDEAKVLHEDDTNKATEQFDYIVRGFNDMFVKEYSFDEDKIKFTIKIKMPNIIENGKVEALRDHYLDGTALNQSVFIYNAYDALALIRVCGKDVPKELAKDENIYEPGLEWLNAIDKDYSNWAARFHA